MNRRRDGGSEKNKQMQAVDEMHAISESDPHIWLFRIKSVWFATPVLEEYSPGGVLAVDLTKDKS